MFRSYVSEARELALCYDDVAAGSRAISLQLAGSARRERRVRRDRLSIETSGFFDSPDSGLAQARGVASLAALVQREANTLAYIDGFWLTVYFALFGLLSVCP